MPNMTNEERKERLARLSALNKKALDVTSFSEPMATTASRHCENNHSTILELRDHIAVFSSRSGHSSAPVWVRRYRHL